MGMRRLPQRVCSLVVNHLRMLPGGGVPVSASAFSSHPNGVLCAAGKAGLLSKCKRIISRRSIAARTGPQGATPPIATTGHDYAQARVRMRSEDALSSAMSDASRGYEPREA